MYGNNAGQGRADDAQMRKLRQEVDALKTELAQFKADVNARLDAIETRVESLQAGGASLSASIGGLSAIALSGSNSGLKDLSLISKENSGLFYSRLTPSAQMLFDSFIGLVNAGVDPELSKLSLLSEDGDTLNISAMSSSGVAPLDLQLTPKQQELFKTAIDGLVGCVRNDSVFDALSPCSKKDEQEFVSRLKPGTMKILENLRDGLNEACKEVKPEDKFKCLSGEGYAVYVRRPSAPASPSQGIAPL